MKHVLPFAALIVCAVCFSLGCTKEQAGGYSASSSTEQHLKSGNPPGAEELLPRIRFRHHYEFILPESAGCGGGECGSCPGFCVIFGGKLGPAPSSEEKGEGIGRARILVGEDALTVVPIDLPMDPGTGKAHLSENLVFDSALATWLGFTKATLLKGEYPIDYSHNELYGRAVISAELVK